jgi:hypothetical protein
MPTKWMGPVFSGNRMKRSFLSQSASNTGPV